MTYECFEFSVDKGVAHIPLNQPEKGNPFNAAFCAEFNELSVICGEDPAIGAVYMDAAGKNFSVGGDLKEFLVNPENLSAEFKRMTANLHMGVARFARNDAPIVVACHNLVVGGALAMVAGADFVYATPKTQFYPAFAAVHLCGDTGVSHFLPRRVGSRKATEMLLLNQLWSAEKAENTGLINAVVAADDIEAHCLAIAQKLAKGPTEVFGRMRRLLLTSFDQPIEAQLEAEARGMVDCANSDAAWAAMRKLVEK